MELLIRNGRVVDPDHLDGIMEIRVADGVITGIAPQDAGGKPAPGGCVIDAMGKIVVPGLVDMHVHLREPGYEHKEDIQSGCTAAAAGGFTAVCPMPNTLPANDSGPITELMIRRAEAVGASRVYPVAAISLGLKGESLSDFPALKNAGAVAFTDDGMPVANSMLMRRALEWARQLDMPVISHSEDLSLIGSGVMNEGPVARRLGYEGIPNAAESIMVMRDIALCELTGGALHIAHVSTAESVRAIRRAKADGIPVTAETAPHYFVLTDDAVSERGANAKMNPPLRSVADRDAVRAGLADGTIDVIATDHAPHTPAEKGAGFGRAPNGVIGLETSVALCLSLVADGVLSLGDLIRKMAIHPARIIGQKSGIRVGGCADLTIIDPELTWVVDAERFHSRSRNTPFGGWEMRGRAVLTLVGGRIVHDEMTQARAGN